MKQRLYRKYPPSKPCSCEICRHYCLRPGWWLVGEAREAIDAGLGARMMLEFAPDFQFGVLAPAFRGNEGYFSLQHHRNKGCTFFANGLCELFATGYQPIECRFCHHERRGLGLRCHNEIAKEWNSAKGRRLVALWSTMRGLCLPGESLSLLRRV